MYFKSFSNTGYILHRNHGHLCFHLGATLHIAKGLMFKGFTVKCRVVESTDGTLCIHQAEMLPRDISGVTSPLMFYSYKKAKHIIQPQHKNL